MKLWGGNYEAAPDAAFWEFNRSFPFDRRLIVEEIAASRAWVRALGRCGAIGGDEAATLDRGLEQVLAKATPTRRTSTLDVEDVHSFVEERLGEIVGDLAGQAHLGRSRNEQTVTALRLFVRGAIDRAARRRRRPRARPRRAGPRGRRRRHARLHAHARGRARSPSATGRPPTRGPLVRDHERLRDARARVDVLPLGSGALAGTALPLDREAMARDLGFAAVSGARSTRSWTATSRSSSSPAARSCRRTSRGSPRTSSTSPAPEYGFVALPEAFTTGSSLMPQKKNPDALELVRGKAARVDGDLRAAARRC